MLAEDEPADFVVGTGESHSVRDFVDAAFAHAGLDPAEHVVEDEALLRPADVDNLVADSTLARERLGWTPATSFEELVDAHGRRRSRAPHARRRRFVSIPLGGASAREPGATLASLLRGVIIVTCLAGSLLAASPATGASRPLRTAIVDPGAYAAADPAPAFALTKGTGARFVRLSLSWARVAPAEPDPMSDPTDPANPAYTWTDFDLQVEQAKAAGLEPIVCIETAATWAGGLHPDPVKFGAFAEAAARRYSDDAVPPVGKPRVRYWQAWNEPNRDYFLMPQYENGQVVSAAHYRSMVNQFAAGRP